MASFLQLLFFFFIFLTSMSFAQRPIFPNYLFLPVTKDGATLQYVTHIYQGTPLVPIKLVVDLGGPFLWLDCSSGYASSAYRPIHCRSIQCSMAKPVNSTCCNNNSTCGLFPENTITRMAARGELGEDILAVQSVDGWLKAGPIATVHHFLFSCAPTFLLNGLASGVKGMLGLGRTRIALPSQLATAFSIHRKFALCLSSSSDGVILSGDGSFVLLPHIMKSLMYTPLITNLGHTSESEEYHINVRSIKINGKRLSINTSLLSMDKDGHGGTKLSTVVPYTTMESTIFNTFMKAYIKAATSMNMTRVASVAPFGACFGSKISIGGGGDSQSVVPAVDLVLQSEMVKWRIHGGNLMVQVSDEVMCLGFLDGGLNSRASIVIGGYQLEDNLLQFDLGTSMLGFSSSLLMRWQTTCSIFKYNYMPKGWSL